MRACEKEGSSPRRRVFREIVMKNSERDQSCRGRVEQFPLNYSSDDRGVLLPFDFHELPFAVQRTFLIDRVPRGVERGGHAHVNGAQYLVCLRGSVEVSCVDGKSVRVFQLQPLKSGLLIGAGIVSSQRFLGEDSLLLVFASTAFDQVEYFFPESPLGS